MQRGGAAGVLPPNPGQAANPRANTPSWFYYLLKSHFLHPDLRVSAFMHKHGEIVSERQGLSPEPAEVSSTLAWGTSSAAGLLVPIQNPAAPNYSLRQ